MINSVDLSLNTDQTVLLRRAVLGWLDGRPCVAGQLSARPSFALDGTDTKEANTIE